MPFMTNLPSFTINDDWILSYRGEKNQIKAREPYAFSREKERQPNGEIKDVITIFLSNSECIFRCLMCDLWKNTTEIPVAQGDIPNQIESALNQLPPAKHIKLYNSGNFFDKHSIPPGDYPRIASLLSEFDTVIVECHPKLIDKDVIHFQKMITPELQVAVGLETVHTKVLERLNKRMNVGDFKRSIQFLADYEIQSRAFILLRPPFLTESEGVFWAKKSLEFAYESGVECCVIIPTRTGNGALDWLQKNDYYAPPAIRSLEQVIEYGIGSHPEKRTFADLWDLEKFSTCDHCYQKRKDRLGFMNLSQKNQPAIPCDCGLN